MKIKIHARNAEDFKYYLKAILDVACTICSRHIPTDEERLNENDARYWLLEPENQRYQLYPMMNDYWFNIKSQDETSLIGEFNVRYDSGQKKALTKVILKFFPDNTEKVE